MRDRLGFQANHVLILALPPAERHTGLMILAWAAFLLEKVRPQVRLVIPGAGREVDRIERLTRACRHEFMVRFVGNRYPLEALLAAADLTAYLPERDAPLDGVLAALRAGRPLVAAAVPSLRKLLAGNGTAWLCRPNDPKDAAKKMLAVLEEKDRQRGNEATRQRG